MPTKRPPYFKFPDGRQRRAMPSPPSPFRLHLVPDGGTARTIGCHRKIRDIKGAMRLAAAFASDVGLGGHIEVHEREGDGWAHRRTATVKNSAVTGWRTP